MNKEKIEKIFTKATQSKHIHEAVLFAENSEADFSVACSYGNKTIDSPMQAASVGKLFTTTCILILQEQNKVSLDSLVVDYFDNYDMEGLHVFKGVDYTNKLKLSDLLFQTSGLPCYESEGGIMKRAIKEDFKVSTQELIDITKRLKPRFAPLGNKTFYSDFNFQLLGEVIEKTTNLPLEEVFRNYIFDPLSMRNTYLPAGDDDVPNMYYKELTLKRPMLMKSLRGGGNTVTTAKELMVFLKAFFKGRFFPESLFDRLSNYRKLQIQMGPIYYGGGYMQIPLNTLMTLFMGKGELIGHSGSTGSFAFYYPEKDMFFVGDVNQLLKPGLPVNLVMRLAMSIK